MYCWFYHILKPLFRVFIRFLSNSLLPDISKKFRMSLHSLSILLLVGTNSTYSVNLLEMLLVRIWGVDCLVGKLLSKSSGVYKSYSKVYVIVPTAVGLTEWCSCFLSTRSSLTCYVCELCYFTSLQFISITLFNNDYSVI